MSDATHSTSGPLAGLRILDMTSVVMGPYATQILGDYGADVIKIESPTGDVIRNPGPARNPGMGAVFLNANRNKRSLVLDLKNPHGRLTLLRLAKSADVVVYNVRPQAMARLQLTYEDFRQENPNIIYAGAFGYGQNGRYAARPAFDDVIQSACAVPDLVARAFGGGQPAYVPINMCDRVAGLHLVNAILAAVVARQRTGEGQCIEVPMFETMVSFILGDHLGARTFNLHEGEMGYARIMTQYRKPFATKDGHMCIIPYNDQHWKDLLSWLNRTDLLEDERFASPEARSANISVVYAFVEEIAAQYTNTEWCDILQELDIPHIPIASLEGLLDDAHLADVDLFQRELHPTEGELTVVRPTTHFSHTPARVTRLAPRLGEHSQQVLRDAGFTADEISQLLETGAVKAFAV